MSGLAPRISVIVAAYNEARSLDELYRRTAAVLEKEGLSFEFIVIDDGSGDGTAEVLAGLRGRHPNLGVISHRRNHGKSMSLMQGFALACGEVAAIMDGDLQDEPENLPAMLEMLGEGYDLVNGWRTRRRDPAAKRLVSALFNLITRRLLKVPLHDINCGMKVMRKDLYKRLTLRGDLHRLIPAMACNLGFRVAEVSISHAPRRHGSSRYPLLRHRGLLDIIALTSTLAYRVRPFHVFSEIAMAAGILFALSLASLILVLTRLHTPLGLYVLAPTLFFATLVFVVIAALFPVVGLILDNLLVHFNDEGWRSSLIKEVLPPEH